MSQSIKNPIGVNVFGSALLRVEPDVALINLSVAVTEKKPDVAFEETRAKAREVREFFAKAMVKDVQSSRITLSQEWEYDDGRRKWRVYVAKVSFNVILEDLDRIEEIVCGAVNAGATEIGKVDFQTRKIKEFRVKARQQAVLAAKQKAEMYAQAAGVSLGRILHIEDVNPDQLRGYEGHVLREFEAEDEGPVTAFDPGAIAVGAAVILACELNHAQ